MRPDTVFLLTIAGIAAAQTTTSSLSSAAMTTPAAILPSPSGGNCNTPGLGSCINGPPQTSYYSCVAQASSNIYSGYACICQSYVSISKCFNQYCIESQNLDPSSDVAVCTITSDAGDGNPGPATKVTPGVVTGTSTASGRGSATGAAASTSTQKAKANGLGPPVAGAAGGALAALAVIFRVFL